MKIAFTGHRPQKLGGYDETNPIALYVKGRITELLTAMREEQPEPPSVISGMALGVDTWAAEIALSLGLPVIAGVPCSNQEKVWPVSSQKRYHAIIAQAVHIHTVAPFYTRDCMQLRNEWMVDECDVLVAIWDGSSGGTANCVRYATKEGRTIIRIDPSER